MASAHNPTHTQNTPKSNKKKCRPCKTFDYGLGNAPWLLRIVFFMGAVVRLELDFGVAHGEIAIPQHRFDVELHRGGVQEIDVRATGGLGQIQKCTHTDNCTCRQQPLRVNPRLARPYFGPARIKQLKHGPPPSSVARPRGRTSRP